MSRRPSGFDDGRWNRIVRGLRDDSRWDSQVFDAIQYSNEPVLFEVSDDLRHQVVYWKNRRNDCAHSKGNAIEYPHVESFWLFIQSNLAKFVVRGSKAGVLEQIRVHFDRSLTPSGTDFGHIIGQIPSAVELEELPEFFERIHLVFLALHPPALGTHSEDEVNFFNGMLDIEQATVTSRLAAYLRRNEELLMAILESNPNRLLYFHEDATLIRRLWYKELAPTSQREIRLYCSLLGNRLIPEDQVQEAHRRIIPRILGASVTEETCTVLERFGFFQTFKKLVFLEAGTLLADKFSWANPNAQLVVFYLDRYGIDKEIARSLSEIFSKENNPFELRDCINQFLSRNLEKRQQFAEVFRKSQIPLPTYLYLEGQQEHIPF